MKAMQLGQDTETKEEIKRHDTVKELCKRNKVI